MTGRPDRAQSPISPEFACPIHPNRQAEGRQKAEGRQAGSPKNKPDTGWMDGWTGWMDRMDGPDGPDGCVVLCDDPDIPHDSHTHEGDSV